MQAKTYMRDDDLIELVAALVQVAYGCVKCVLVREVMIKITILLNKNPKSCQQENIEIDRIVMSIISLNPVIPLVNELVLAELTEDMMSWFVLGVLDAGSTTIKLLSVRKGWVGGAWTETHAEKPRIKDRPLAWHRHHSTRKFRNSSLEISRRQQIPGSERGPTIRRRMSKRVS